MRWSIVICTLNRGNELKHAIDGLTQLDSPVDTYEIIIVDNDSTDSTGEIVRSIFGQDQTLSLSRKAALVSTMPETQGYVRQKVSSSLLLMTMPDRTAAGL